MDSTCGQMGNKNTELRRENTKLHIEIALTHKYYGAVSENAPTQVNPTGACGTVKEYSSI